MMRVTVEIVILAMIAAFLGLRLYSVLGRRAEHGEEPMQSRLDAAPHAGPGTGNVRPADRAAALVIAVPRNRDASAADRAVIGQVASDRAPQVERGLRDIAAADRRFDATSFVDGARAAYRMILEAYWRGDRDELAHLCDGPVWQSFSDEITARAAAGEVVDNRLVRINEAVIVAAGLMAADPAAGRGASPFAHVTVRFVADIAAVTRDSEGHVIAGSLDDAVEVRDVWSFRRDVASANPDWLLDETDEG